MELSTARLLLREFELTDLEATHAYERDPEVMRYQSSAPRSLEESRAALVRGQEFRAAQPRTVFDFAVCLHDTGALMGRAGFGYEQEHRNAKLWYVLHPAQQGKGYVSEACRALMRFGFEELGAHRFWVDIDPRNAPSVRVAERLGMRREAMHLENFWCKGEWTDSLILALLHREWRSVRDAHVGHE